MKFKKSLIAVLCVAAVLVFGLTACKKDDTAPTPVSVTISQSALEMDIYDTHQLTAQATGTEEAIVWSTSNDSVVTVADGLVSAVGEGSATVTAAAGGASASCAVTVTNSHTAPVMKLNRESVSVAIDGEFTVTVTTEWKGTAIEEPIQYTWALKDGESGTYASVTPSADGSSAVIKGLAYGETVYCVSAEVRGTLLVKEISIKVCNTDITFDITNLQPGAGSFIADVSLVGTADDPAEVTPNILVYDKGVLVENAEIVWSVEDPTVAAIDQGTITALKEGTTMLTGTYDNNTVKISVNAYRPRIALAQEVEIETAVGGTVTLEEALVGNVTGARLNGTDVYKSYDAAQNSVTFDTEKMNMSVSEMGEGKELIIDTDMAQYVATAAVYTKILRTPNDVLTWNELSYAADEANTYWGGYFVLGNDIDMAGTQFEGKFYYSNMHDTTTWSPYPQYSGLFFRDGNTGGFRGVFDGRGYNIDNLYITSWTGSFCGQIAKEGVIRNVSFTNVKLGQAACLISVGGNGRIENVYAHIASAQTGNVGNNDKTGVFFGGDTMADARVINCFVVFDTIPAAGDRGFSGLGSYHLGYNILNGVYGVGIDPSQAILTITSIGGGDTYGGFATFGDFLNAGIDVSDWDPSFWNVEGGIPYPKNLTFPEGSVPAITVSEYAAAGSELLLSGMTKYDVIALSDEAAALGVTYSGNTVNIPETAEKGTQITFSVHSVYDADKKAEFTVSIVESNTIDYPDTVEVEVEGGETFTVDLSSYADEIAGTLSRVLLDDEAMTEPVYESGILTLKNEDLIGKWGMKSVTVEFVEENNGVLESTTFVNIELDIVTMIINDEAELNRFLEVAQENKVGNSWAGIYKLGNDIYCTGTYASRYVGGDTRGDMGVAAGFNGTFDGCGYTIYNLHTVGDQGGFVGPLGKHGVVKNVSFVNAKNTGNGAFIASTGVGTIENVFIQIDITPNANSWGPASSVIVSDPYGDFRINKVLIEYINTLPADATTGYPVWNIHKGWGILNGVYAIGVSKFYQNLGENLNDSDVYGVFDTWDDFIAAGISFASWDNDFWDIAAGIPVPGHLLSDEAPAIGNTNTQLPAGGTLTIECDAAYIDITLDETAIGEGFSINGKTVTIPADAAGKSFTVKVKSVLNGKSSEKTFTIIENTVVDVATQTEIDMTQSNALVFDLGEYEAEGTVLSATIGDKTFSAVTFEGGILTLDRATIENMYGEYTIVLMLSGNATLTTVNIPVLLVTKYISTPSDLINLLDYTVGDTSRRGGYFIQTADIDVGGARAGFGGYSNEKNDWENTFVGTYDGDGYVISNMTQGTNAGIFACMNGGAVLKNVTFINATLNGEGGLLTTGMYNATIENVAVYGKISGSTGASWAPASLMVSKAYENSTIRNCLVVLASHSLTGSNYAGMIVGDDQSFGSLVIENCIAVNLQNAELKNDYVIPAIGSNGAGGRLAENTDTDSVHTFHGWAQYLAWADGKDLTAYAGGNVWGFNAENVPVTKAASVLDSLAMLDVSAIPVIVPANETTAIVLNGIGYYANFSLEEAQNGLSLQEGVLTVQETYGGNVVNLNVISLLDSAKNQSITIDVVEMVTLSERTEIELNNTSVVNTIDLTEAGEMGTVESLKVGQKTLTASFEGTSFTLTNATEELLTVWGDNTLELVMSMANGREKVVYIPVTVITKVLRTPEDVLNWNELSYAADEANTYWSGYFVLGNDIDMAGTQYQGKFYYGNLHDTSNWTVLPQYAGLEFRNGNTGGFRGVFDGRGYTIDNLHITSWTGSFCGLISQQGVIRNVSFTNVILDPATCLISIAGNGRIENIYAHILSASSGSASNSDKTGVFFGQDTMAAARVVNCFVKFESVSGEGDGGFTGMGAYHLGYGILNNVYAVGIAPSQAISVISNAGTGDVYGAYRTAEEFAAAVTVSEANGWDMEYWTTDADGLPIPRTLLEGN